ncbi:MAG TPA: EAL domain-containing protein [Solirubrobacteraceae bacterium]|nr:EAL domain-containing protein [Solirubrobacteraceae bacterium]
MLGDLAAGAALLTGGLACAGAALLRPGERRARVVLAAALAAAAVAELAAADGLGVAACALAAAGIGLLVLDRSAPIDRLSWLDAAMGASATAGLAATLGARAAETVAAGGVAGSLALSRWRPGRAVVLAAAGLAALGAGPALAPLAAFAIGAAAWLRESAPEPGPEFSPIVLAAILTFATVALTLLAAGQFASLADVTVALAIVTVLSGMARAGLTVVERLRESREQAVTDDLTGLGNRRHLVDRLHATIEGATEAGDEVALLVIDLDGFKELNDTLGHHAGDEVLRQVGPRLKQLLRTDDTLARLGGDEFAVVLRPGDEASASTAGLRLRAALERSFEVGGIRVHVDASVGIALFPEHSLDAMGLLQRADVAMYEAKRMRTGHEVYLAGRDHHSRQRLALVGEVHGALEAGELVLNYQPKAELRTGAVRGVEALVRWEHPERGLLGPIHFLPLVEQSGLTRALTAFVLDRALEEIGEVRHHGFDLSVAVNLGPADLLDLGLPSEVERLLRHHRFGPEHLQIEVSEDVVMVDVERTVAVLVGLRAIGVSTALDDFGAGHAGLGHLKQLPVDVLKIDRSFVMRITQDERDAAIVHSLVDLGRRLGVRVIAEGVDTLGSWSLLSQWGCDEAQGHFLSRPMPAPELADWLMRLSRRAGGVAEPQLWAAVRD